MKRVSIAAVAIAIALLPQAARGFEEKRLATYPSDVDMITFAPGGRHVAFRAFEGKKQLVVVDERKGEEFDEVASPGFAPDGETVFYRARRDDRWFAVVGSEKSEPYDDVQGIAVSGGRRAFLARLGNRRFLVTDGRVAGPDGGTGYFDWPIFSPDSKTLAHRALCPKDRWTFVVNGVTHAEEFDEAAWPAFSPDSKQFAFLARTGKKWEVVLGKERRPALGDSAEFLTLAPDGTPAYVATEGKKQFVVAGEKRGATLDAVRGWTLRFRPGGKDVAYVANSNGSWHVFAGDEKSEPWWQVISLAWSPDGRTVAYSALKEQRWRVVAGGRESETFDWIERVEFSADGKTVGFGVSVGREFWWKVVPATTDGRKP